MRVLVLWADESSANLGVSALARGSSALIDRAWPGAEVTFVNYGNRPEQLPFGRVRSLAKERVTGRLGMRRWLSEFDLAWDTRSGDSFADIYGLGRHRTMSAIHELTVGAGVPTVMAPQTVGPFRTRRGRWLARRTLRRSCAVFARDPVSADYASTLGRPVDRTASDLVFAIDQPEVSTPRDVVLNVSGLLWAPNPHVDAAHYRTTIHALMDGLWSQGRDITVLAHVRHSQTGDDDVPAIREIAGDARREVEVVIPADLDEARAVLGSARIVVGSRMHACLNALSAGIPAVPLAYSRKFDPLLEALGWSHSVDLRTGDDAAGAVADLVLGADLSHAARAVRDRGQAHVAALVEDLRALV